LADWRFPLLNQMIHWHAAQYQVDCNTE